MPSRRSATLPRDWQRRRRGVLARDGNRCTEPLSDGSRCKQTDHLEVHHIGSESDHSDGNLRTLCSWHHDKYTAAKAASRRKRLTQRRDPEKHPGLL